MPTLLLLLLAFRPSEAHARLDARLFAGRAADEKVSVLVVLREQADLSGAAGIGDRIERRRFVYEALRAQAESSQAELKEDLRRQGVRFRSHFLVNVLEVEADRATAERLSARRDVASVAANRPSAWSGPALAERSSRASVAGIEPNLVLVGAPQLWELGFTGGGIVIGVADTGFQWDHPALLGHYRGWDGSHASHDYNWHDAIHDAPPENPCGSDAPAPCDDYGHGTGTAGFAVGQEGEDTIGVAPGAALIGCRNMEGGIGSPERYIECFEWFLAPTDSQGENPRPDLGPDVINNSWGCPASEGCTDPDVLNAVVDNVRAAGIGMAFSAGNLGASCSTLANAPAVGPGSFAIGATGLDDAIAFFSAFGPVTSDGSNRLKPDMTAPGLNLRTAGLDGTYFLNFSGTSAAAPHVAGAFALLWSAVPVLRGNVDLTEQILEQSAVHLTFNKNCGEFKGSAVPNVIFGWGRLDIPSAWALAVLATQRIDPLLAQPDRATRVLPPRP
ncbi:MAG: S8 family serine peptidase [Acidobacteriota bacterium]